MFSFFCFLTSLSPIWGIAQLAIATETPLWSQLPNMEVQLCISKGPFAEVISFMAKQQWIQIKLHLHTLIMSWRLPPSNKLETFILSSIDNKDTNVLLCSSVGDFWRKALHHQAMHNNLHIWRNYSSNALTKKLNMTITDIKQCITSDYEFHL